MKINRKGQALVEYVLIVAIVSVIIIGVFGILSGYIKDSITKSSCTLIDEVYKKGKNPGEGKCVEKDSK